MTPLEGMTIAVERVGLKITNPTVKDRARDYGNMILKDIGGLTTWRWLYKLGTLTTAASTREYQLASDVLYARSFRNVTDDQPLTIIHPEAVDDFDLNDDDTSDIAFVAVTGMDSTGVWNVDVVGTPQAVVTLKYRYYAFIADLTSANDETEMATLNVPAWMQPAYAWGISALYKEEKGIDASEEWGKYSETLDKGLKVNGGLSSDTKTRLSRNASERVRDPYQPREGSLA